MDKTEEVLTRSVIQILPDKSKLLRLMKSQKIRIYLGIDPTGPRLHLGHTIGLRKLQSFADLGHEVMLVFGTGTVLAGDPSQRKEKRKTITQSEISQNIKNWKTQAEKILDFSKIKVVKNGDWLLKLDIPKLIEIESQISATQLFKREMFQERLNRGDTVWYHETLYPILQGYDSVYLNIDLEIGGTDQVFNMLIGRELQKKINNHEKYILTTPLILGTDGNQMTKSKGNCIWLNDIATEMFGKIMSMSDDQIEQYWTNLTNLETNELKKLKPLDAKKKLAYEIVKIYHSQDSASQAQKEFERVFQNKEFPAQLQVVETQKMPLLDFIANQLNPKSKSGAKRLLSQGSVEINGKIAKDGKVQIEEGQQIKIGKKTYLKIEIKS